MAELQELMAELATSSTMLRKVRVRASGLCLC
jgi:hypothetical protein